MKLKATGFSPNGRGDLTGTVIAYSDNGEPLGVEHTANYSRDGGNAMGVRGCYGNWQPSALTQKRPRPRSTGSWHSSVAAPTKRWP